MLPFADRSLDGAVGWDVMEHLKHPEVAIREMSRVLKPGGFIHMVVPNPEAYTRGTDKFTYAREYSHIWPPIVTVDFFEKALTEFSFSPQIYTRGFPESAEFQQQTGRDLIVPASFAPDGLYIIAFGIKQEII